MGSTVNMAARLMGLAELDQVLVDKETARLAASHVQCDSIGLHNLKGFDC
jgi:class 3 adenylate cyclase